MSGQRPPVRSGHIARATWALCAGTLLAACSYLLLQTDSTPEAGQYEALIHELSAQNFKRNSEVLLARSGLIKHFDHLMQTERTLRGLHRRLRDVPSFIDRPDRELIGQKIERSEGLRLEAEQMVEDFKRQLSVLSNSSGVVTTLSRDSYAFSSAGQQDWSLTQLLNETLRRLFTLEVTHDPDIAHAAQASLLELEAARPTAPVGWVSDLRLMIHHGRLIITNSLAVDELTRKLSALPHEQATDALLREYLRAQKQAMRTRHSERNALIVLFFLLGFVVALAIIQRLRRAACALEVSGAELKQAVESLEVEKNKQAELAELKSRFVSTTSHEFRTPLSVILSSAEMLTAYAEIWNQEKKEQHLVRIRAAALSMTRMLEDVLLLGRAESGRLSFVPAPLKLADLCHEVASLAEQASGQLARIQTHCKDDVTVHADETLLRHILGNLLSNALKYSPKDAPVRFSGEVDSKTLHFIVQDEGIGIPEDDQRHLFDSFHRGSNVGRVSGTGLGLSIVKRALDLQSGDISIDSKLGRGTTVHVHIPIEEAEK